MERQLDQIQHPVAFNAIILHLTDYPVGFSDWG